MNGLPKLSTLFSPRVPGIDGYEVIVASWRYGEIAIAGAQVRSIQARWWPRWGTVLGMWTDRISRSLPADECRFYYAFPRSSPRFMSLLYTHAGPQTVELSRPDSETALSTSLCAALIEAWVESGDVIRSSKA